MNIRKTTVWLLAAGCCAVAFADFEIALDAGAKPIKDMSNTGCNQGIGFNAALESVWGAANDDFWFVSNKFETARVLKEAGVNLVRLRCMNRWFDNRKPNPYDPDSKNPKERNKAKNYRRSNPKYPSIAPYWKAFIDEAEKIWPKIPLGMNIGGLFELNPDIVHMRSRLMSCECLAYA